jgi:SAM-dependent methyltransferase
LICLRGDPILREGNSSNRDIWVGDIDVPSPIDFHDAAQARAWETDTIARRPWRPEFFAAFASALSARFRNEFRVLELGSGPGHLAKVILAAREGADYCALDFSEAMHALARERLGQLASRVDFITADFRAPDWPQKLPRFDAVVTIQAAHELRHKRHLPKLLEQVREVLKPAGVFLYCDHYAEGGQNPDLMLKREEQPRALEAAGFCDIVLLLDKGGMALYSARTA